MADSVSVFASHFDPLRGQPERRLPADSRAAVAGFRWPAPRPRAHPDRSKRFRDSRLIRPRPALVGAFPSAPDEHSGARSHPGTQGAQAPGYRILQAICLALSTNPRDFEVLVVANAPGPLCRKSIPWAGAHPEGCKWHDDRAVAVRSSKRQRTSFTDQPYFDGREARAENAERYPAKDVDGVTNLFADDLDVLPMGRRRAGVLASAPLRRLPPAPLPARPRRSPPGSGPSS